MEVTPDQQQADGQRAGEQGRHEFGDEDRPELQLPAEDHHAVVAPGIDEDAHAAHEHDFQHAPVRHPGPQERRAREEQQRDRIAPDEFERPGHVQIQVGDLLALHERRIHAEIGYPVEEGQHRGGHRQHPEIRRQQQARREHRGAQPQPLHGHHARHRPRGRRINFAAIVHCELWNANQGFAHDQPGLLRLRMILSSNDSAKISDLSASRSTVRAAKETTEPLAAESDKLANLEL